MKKNTSISLLALYSLLVFPSGLKAENGFTEGILVGKGANNDWLNMRPDGNATAGEILVPNDLVEAVSHLYSSNRVKVKWEKTEGATHPTATAVQNLRPAENQGTVTGKVVDKFDDNWIEIKPADGPLRRYVPRWLGGNDGGNDQVAGDLIRETEVGSEVNATWEYDERIRLVSLMKLEEEINPDLDGDGFPNEMENAAGSNPNDANSTPPLSYGLVAHWKFDEANGTLVEDSSGNGITGNLVGASQNQSSAWEEGKIGGALRLDGTDDHVSFQGASSLNDLKPFSFSGWIKAETEQGGYILAKRSETSGYWRISANAQSITWVRSYSGNTHPSLTGNLEQAVNQWRHVVFTWTGEKTGEHSALYVNGDPLTNLTRTEGSGDIISDAENLFTIGNRPQNNSSYFKGLIDDYRIYNRVLTPNETEKLFAEGVEQPNPQPEPETGAVEGILVGKGANNDWLDVQPDGNATAGEILVPNELVEAVSHLYTPNRVKIEWSKAEGATHPTATSVQNLRPGENQGTVTGKVVAKDDDNWIEIKQVDGPLRRYQPRWIGGNTGGLDQVAKDLIREAEVGSDVNATWEYDERIRLVSMVKLGGEHPNPQPENHSPKLREPWVKPQQGTSETSFVFEVLYMDPDGDEPKHVTLRLDEETLTLERSSEGPEGSTWYRREVKNLGTGSHKYSFITSDGEKLTDTHWNTGPHVEAIRPPEPKPSEGEGEKLPEWLVKELEEEEEAEKPRFGIATGKVLDGLGTPVSDTEIVAHTPDRLLWREAKTGEEGSFDLGHLAPGKWILRAFPPAKENVSRTARESAAILVEIEAGQTASIDLRLRQANLVGRVLTETDDGNKSVHDAKVWVFLDANEDGEPDSGTSEDTEGFTETDRQGNFSFLLPPGRYGLYLKPPSGLPRQKELSHFTIENEQDTPHALEILLAAPKHFITGTVLDQFEKPVSGVQVILWGARNNDWRRVEVDTNGTFSAKVGPGVWEIAAKPLPEVRVDWSAKNSEQRFKLPDDGDSITRTVSLFVERREEEGTVTGIITKPSGSAEWGSDAASVSVEVYSAHGDGGWAAIAEDGSFFITLAPGDYAVSVFSKPNLGYAKPEPINIRVKSREVEDLGNLALVSRSGSIQGIVSDENGTVLPNFRIFAWNGRGAHVSTVTGLDGSYELAVQPGRWKVGYEVPASSDGSASPYLEDEPRKLRVVQGETAEVSFQVAKAASPVKGSVVTSEGTTVVGIEGWVYARKVQEGSNDDFNIVAEARVDERGRFELSLPDGEFLLGIWLPDDAPYSMIDETPVHSDSSEATIQLKANDATISGTLTIAGQPAGNLVGEVFAVAMVGEEWKSTPVSEDGSFELQVGAGKWVLLYKLERIPPDMVPIALQSSTKEEDLLLVEVESGASTNVEFQLVKIEGTISGTVVDDTGTPTTNGVYVWIEQVDGKGKYSREIKLTDGAFQVEAPLSAEFAVGAYISPTLRKAGYLEPVAQTVKLTDSGTVEIQLTLSRKKTEEYLSGIVKSTNGAPLANAFVYAWSPNGQGVEGKSDANGSFRLEVSTGSHWFVGADYVDGETGATLAVRKEALIDLTEKTSQDGLEVVLETPEFVVPDGIVETFDPSRDFTTVLPDGTQIFIPANAATVSEDTKEVRLLAEPIASGLSRNVNEKPLDYGYSIELTDADGKEIGHSFNKDVRISIAYDATDLERANTNKEDLAVSFFSADKGAWENASATIAEGRIHAKVEHFSQWAATAPSTTPGTVPTANPLAKGLIGIEGADGWYQSDWFGYFNDAGNGWTYHSDHGWLYPAEDETGNYWFYIPNLGWLWSGPSFYGNIQDHAFLYSNDLQTWLHYQAETQNFHVYQGTGYLIDHAGVTSASVVATPSDTAGGTVTGSGTYSINTNQILTAYVNPGFKFTGWTDAGGNSLSTDTTLEVNVSGDIAIKATFLKQTESEILGGIFD